MLKLIVKNMTARWLAAGALTISTAFAGIYAIKQLDKSYIRVSANRSDFTYNLGDTAVVTVEKLITPGSNLNLTLESYFNGEKVETQSEQNIETFQTAISSYGPKSFKVIVFMEDESLSDSLRKSIASVNLQLQQIQESIDQGMDDPNLLIEKTRLLALKQSYEQRLGANRISVEEKTLTLLVNDPRPRITFASNAQTATKGQVGPVSVLINLDRPAVQTLVVPFTVSGTANGPQSSSPDHTLASGSVTFQPNETSKVISFSINSTATTGWPKTVILTLGTANNAELGSQIVHTVTINNSGPTLPKVTGLRVSVETSGLPAYVQFGFRGLSDSTLIGAIDFDFGDGKIIRLSKAEWIANETLRHLYKQAGNFTVKVKVIGLDGSESEVYEQQVHIANKLKPIVGLTISKVPGQSSTLRFDASESINPNGGSIAFYGWLFSDGTPESKGENPIVEHQFIQAAAPGPAGKTFNVRLRVSNPDLERTQVTFTVKMSSDYSVNLIGPVIVLNHTLFVGQAPFSVNFDASKSFGLISNLKTPTWDFNDPFYNFPAMVRGSSVQHTYRVPGTYQPTVRVFDEIGNSVLQGITVIVTDPTLPDGGIPEFLALASASSNTNINFSTSRLGSAGAIDPLHMFWDLGNGSTTATSGRSASASYSLPIGSDSKVFYPQFKTIDVFGNRRDVSKALTIRSDGYFPTLSDNQVPNSLSLNETVSIDASGISDPLGLSVNARWYFCDGSSQNLSTTGQNFTKTFTANGLCPVNVELTNSEGRSSTFFNLSNIVSGTGPMAQATIDKVVGYAPLTVSFDASVSKKTQNNIADYLWNFNDYSSAENISVVPAITRTYATAGTYSAQLYVRDTAGNVTNKSFQIVVNSGAPPEDLILPVADFSIYKSDNYAYLDASASIVDPRANIMAWQWEYDDGFMDFSTTNNFTEHTYSSANTYNIKLTITDSFGQKSSVVKPFTTDAPPFLAKKNFLSKLDRKPAFIPIEDEEEGCYQVGEVYRCVIKDHGENLPDSEKGSRQ